MSRMCIPWSRPLGDPLTKGFWGHVWSQSLTWLVLLLMASRAVPEHCDHYRPHSYNGHAHAPVNLLSTYDTDCGHGDLATHT